MNTFAVLPTFRLATGTEIAQSGPPGRAAVTLDSPAIEVMTDLTRVRAATTTPGTLLHVAEQTMVYLGVRMLFVVSHMPVIEGLITSNDLQGETPMRVVHQRGVHHDELCVADVMTPLASLDAIDLDRLQHASVGDIVATLKRFGRNHLLVEQAATATTPRRVRGVISRAQIERQLGLPVEVAPIANDFIEIERALA